MSFTVLRFKRYRDDDAPDLLYVSIRDPKKSKHIDLSSPKRDIAIFRKVDKDDLLRKLEESSRKRRFCQSNTTHRSDLFHDPNKRLKYVDIRMRSDIDSKSSDGNKSLFEKVQNSVSTQEQESAVDLYVLDETTQLKKLKQVDLYVDESEVEFMNEGTDDDDFASYDSNREDHDCNDYPDEDMFSESIMESSNSETDMY